MDNKTYILILEDTLTQKNCLLDQLIHQTTLQEECIKKSELDLEQMDSFIAEKSLLIEKLNFLDDGFEKIYDHVKNEIVSNPIKHKEQIIKLQNLIKLITEKSTILQAKEKENKIRIDMYLFNKKKEIKNYKVSSVTATNYYKNMRNQYDGQSLFLDKKK